MNNVTIKSTHNDPVVGLHEQIDNLISQSTEYSKYDDKVIGFDGVPTKKEDEEKLYMPVEQYTNYSLNYHISNKEKELIIFLLLGLLILIIFAIITSNR